VVTSGKPADVGRLGTSIPKFKPVSAFFTMLEHRVETGKGATPQKTTPAKLYRIAIIPGAPFFWPMELAPGEPIGMSLPITGWRPCLGSRGDLLLR